MLINEANCRTQPLPLASRREQRPGGPNEQTKLDCRNVRFHYNGVSRGHIGEAAQHDLASYQRRGGSVGKTAPWRCSRRSLKNAALQHDRNRPAHVSRRRLHLQPRTRPATSRSSKSSVIL
jgi:hypothetical protein